MDFPPYNFDSMNEADVREEVVAPLLRHLGYQSGTANNVIRGQYLSYRRMPLGRRKPTVRVIRGKADYICSVGGLVNWVIEAKSPAEFLNELTEEQAWTYANHPEIRAVFFVITNGRELKLYLTNRGPKADALFACTYEQLEKNLTTIKNMLSPEAILRDHPILVVDTNPPIGPGLRSIVRVVGGFIRYTKTSIPIPPLEQMNLTVTGGSVERNEDGFLEAYLWTRVPYQSLQELNEKLGLDQMLLISASTVVSANPSQPTLFESEKQTILPKGMVALNMMDWSNAELPMNVTVVLKTRAAGYRAGTVFKGEFSASVSYLEWASDISLDGMFELQLA